MTSGAYGDIRQATHMTRSMVCHLGMSDKLGMVNYGEQDEPVFLGRDIGRGRDYSEATAQEIDLEVKRFCDEAYQKATEIISANREKLDAIALALLEYETLSGLQVRELIDTGRMSNPPKTGLEAATPMPPPLKTPTREPEGGVIIAPDYPSGLAEAPAGA